MGVAATVINAERKEAVDFSQPFMTTGIAALMLKPSDLPGRGMFTFLAPFSLELWIFFVSSFGLVFVIMFFVSFFTTRVSSTKPGMEHSACGTIYKSLCYSLEAFTPHYIDSYYARSISGRVIGNIWWLFIVFVFSAYTASMVPFLSKESRIRPIRSVEDLPLQSQVDYGFSRQSMAKKYFENPNLNSTAHRRMWEVMNSKPDVFKNSNAEGVDAVRSSKGNYVFFMEANAVAFVNTQRPCDTMQLGDTFGVRSFAVAVPKGSSLRKHLDEAIAHLSETGELDKLKKKWWTQKSYCQYPERKKDETVMPLDNFIGVFFILGGGVALGILVGLIEFIYKCCVRSSAAKGTVPETTSTGEATITEKEFAEQALASA